MSVIGTGKDHGEGNVHVARWERDFAAKPTDELLALWNNRTRLPGGRLTAWHSVMQRELRRRGTHV